jgi:hypothetical protein
MRRHVSASLSTLAAVVALAAPAAADCSKEVVMGISLQSEQKSFRKETNMISEQGPIKLMVEYQKPDRMRQVVTLLIDPKPQETILVGNKAWANTPEGWRQLEQSQTEQLVQFFQKSTQQTSADVGEFECMGAETIDGKKLRAYRGLPPKVVDPKDPAKMKEHTTQKTDAVRMVYIDPDNGLPARTIFARKDFLDKPIFKEVYTYPTDIKIEPPANVKP